MMDKLVDVHPALFAPALKIGDQLPESGCRLRRPAAVVRQFGEPVDVSSAELAVDGVSELFKSLPLGGAIVVG
jgi:hypothetical protein